MRGEEHARRRRITAPTPPCLTRAGSARRLLLVLLGFALEALGYSAGRTASFTMSIRRPLVAGPKLVE